MQDSVPRQVAVKETHVLTNDQDPVQEVSINIECFDME